MNSFLKKSVLFALMISGIYLVLYAISMNSKYKPNDYIDAIVDKHKRVESIKGRQVLLIGDSNIAFGLDSDVISDSVNLPVTNMALEVGLGLEFILEEAKDLLEPNDVAVLSIEYLMTLEGSYMSKYQAGMALPVSSDYFDRDINSELIIDNYFTRKRLFEFNTTKISNRDIVYNRKAFNEFGDLTSHRTKKPHKGNLMLPPPQETDKEELITAIDEFTQYCKRNRISVYYTFPSIAQSAYTKNAALINQFTNRLNQIDHLIFLDGSKESVKPDSLFFDSVFHLTYNERAKRSKILGNHLKNALKS